MDPNVHLTSTVIHF